MRECARMHVASVRIGYAIDLIASVTAIKSMAIHTHRLRS